MGDFKVLKAMELGSGAFIKQGSIADRIGT